jgi:hypothetical protein
MDRDGTAAHQRCILSKVAWSTEKERLPVATDGGASSITNGGHIMPKVARLPGIEGDSLAMNHCSWLTSILRLQHIDQYLFTPRMRHATFYFSASACEEFAFSGTTQASGHAICLSMSFYIKTPVSGSGMPTYDFSVLHDPPLQVEAFQPVIDHGHEPYQPHDPTVD